MSANSTDSNKTTPETPNLPAPIEDNPPTKIDIGRAIKMRYQNGNTYQEIADVFGVRKQSIYSALKPFDKLLKGQAELSAFRKNQVPILESIMMEFAGDMADPNRRKKASLNNVAYSFDRIFNAIRLLRGESTANVEHAHGYASKLDEIEREIAELEGTNVNANVNTDSVDVVEAEIERLEDELGYEADEGVND